MSWILKLRGDSTAPILAEYECPVHGRFEITLPRPAPDVVSCPLNSWSVARVDKEYASREEAAAAALEAGIDPEQAFFETQRCAEDSPWRFPMPHGRVKAGEVVQGKSDPRPPESVMLDTRPLADGMPYSEWKAKQDKITADININQHRRRQGRTRKVLIG